MFEEGRHSLNQAVRSEPKRERERNRDLGPTGGSLDQPAAAGDERALPLLDVLGLQFHLPPGGPILVQKACDGLSAEVGSWLRPPGTRRELDRRIEPLHGALEVAGVPKPG